MYYVNVSVSVGKRRTVEALEREALSLLLQHPRIHDHTYSYVFLCNENVNNNVKRETHVRIQKEVAALQSLSLQPVREGCRVVRWSGGGIMP